MSAVNPRPHFWRTTLKRSLTLSRAIIAYLRSIPPIAHRVPKNVAPGETPTAAYLRLVEGQ